MKKIRPFNAASSQVTYGSLVILLSSLRCIIIVGVEGFAERFVKSLESPVSRLLLLLLLHDSKAA